MKYIFLLVTILLAFATIRAECEPDPDPEALALAEGNNIKYLNTEYSLNCHSFFWDLGLIFN